MNKDNAQRFIFEEQEIRGEIVHLNTSYLTILQQHPYPPFIKKLLGEALVAAILLTSTLKFEGELTIQFQSEASLSLLIAKCSHDLNIRSLAQWDEAATEEQFLASFVKGRLVITVMTKNNNSLYQSIVPLNHRDMAQSLEYYFKQSEQLETKLWLCAGQENAAGMLLQLMPAANIESRQQYWEHVITLAETLKPQELLELNNIDLLHRLYHQENITLYEPLAIRFRCTCSLEKMENAIVTLSRAETEELLQAKHKIIVTCEYCGNEYAFDKVDVAHIFSTKKRDPLH